MNNLLTKYHEDTITTCEIMARTRYKLQNVHLWTLGVRSRYATQHTTYYSKHMHQVSWKYNNDLWVMAQTRYKLQNVHLWPLSVTLTFNIKPWVLYMTQLHIIVNICTKCHEDITIICEVMAKTRYNLQNNSIQLRNLWPLSVALTFDI